MTSFWSNAAIAAIAFTCIASAQSQDATIQGAIDDFRGTAKKAKDANPVLSTVEKGPGVMLEKLGMKQKVQGAGPIQVTLSKEQQEDIERRRKIAEKAELDAKKRTSRPQPVMHAKAVTPAVAPAPVVPATPPPPPAKTITIVPADSLTAITPGMERQAVIAALGKPSDVSTIAGLEGGPRETFYYHLDPQHRVMVKLVDGKVQSVAR